MAVESKRRKMDEHAVVVFSSSDDASCSLEDEFLALGENLDAEGKGAEGVAENIRRTFLAAMRAAQPDELSNRPSRFFNNSARTTARKTTAIRRAAAGCWSLTKYWAAGEVNAS
ncbi:unnamed protein product [Albugo candida]|uniref:Uncharacterized protein n=1 Tax=Albugo candida TaxID=65357 RepID=A0A024GML7_9STRA|nr:unnamed protein product [Albugo candida]|eukprot:CCI47944.1 unnamed protein product [Albugo candida]